MIKTVKGKVIAGVMAVALVSGGGAALGATDAGQGLKDWYNTQFNKSSGTIATDTLKHSATGFGGFAEDVKDLKSGATERINATRTQETNDAVRAIYFQGQEYIESVDVKDEEIRQNIDREFEEIERKANEVLSTTGKIALGLARADLQRHTGSEGRKALDHLEREINTQTDISIYDVSTVITDAKSGLLALLNTKSGVTIGNINAAVDAEIATILGVITTETEKLVTKQKDAITEAAAKLQAAAMKELDDEVIKLIKK